MKRLTSVTCAVALCSILGCGSNSSSVNTNSAQSAKAPQGAASAEQVAKEMRGNVKCPATAVTPPAAGEPVDDVTGIRPGMTWNEAANFAMCDNPLMVVTENSRNFNVNTYGQHIRQGFDAKFAEPRVVKSGQQILQDMNRQEVQRENNAYVAPLQPGQSRYGVTFMGLPGQERVISVSREEFYADGKQPTLDSVTQALISKYGPPSYENAGGGRTYLDWEFDPSGARIPMGSPLHGQCGMNSPTPDSAVNLSSGCGVTVGANINVLPSNPGLAHDLDVMSQNGAQGIAAIKAVADNYQKSNDAKQADEIKNASKNAPKL